MNKVARRVQELACGAICRRVCVPGAEMERLPRSARLAQAECPPGWCPPSFSLVEWFL